MAFFYILSALLPVSASEEDKQSSSLKKKKNSRKDRVAKRKTKEPLDIVMKYGVHMVLERNRRRVEQIEAVIEKREVQGVLPAYYRNITDPLEMVASVMYYAENDYFKDAVEGIYYRWMQAQNHRRFLLRESNEENQHDKEWIEPTDPQHIRQAILNDEENVEAERGRTYAEFLPLAYGPEGFDNNEILDDESFDSVGDSGSQCQKSEITTTTSIQCVEDINTTDETTDSLLSTLRTR